MSRKNGTSQERVAAAAMARPMRWDHLAVLVALSLLALAALVLAPSAARAAQYLPPNLIADPGTQVASFDDAGAWTQVPGYGSTIASGPAREGTASLQLTTDGVIDSDPRAAVETILSSPVDMSSMTNGGHVRFWIYLSPDWSSTTSGFTVRLGTSTADFGNGQGLSYTLWNMSGMHAGWNQVSVGASSFVSGPDGMTWLVPVGKVGIELWPHSGQVCTAAFDDLKAGVVSSPAVVIGFDDALTSVKTKAFPIMAARGLVGTVYADLRDIDEDPSPGGDYMDFVDLRDLYAQGWDVGNHTATHPEPNLTGLTLEEVKTELATCTQRLIAEQLPRAAYDVAYPGAQYNATVLQAMAETGMRSGRTADFRTLPLPVDEPYAMPACATSDATQSFDAAFINGRIDQAIADGAVIQLLFHGVTDNPNPPDPTYEMQTSVFQAVMDHIAQAGIPSITISQLMNHSQDPVTGDFTAPVTTATPTPATPASGWQTAESVTVHLAADDGAGVGVDFTEYSLDGGATWTDGVDVVVTAEGTTTVSFRSADKAGNRENTKTVDVSIDRTKPVTTAELTPATAWSKDAVTVTLAATDNTGGSGLSRTYYTVGSGTEQEYTAPFQVADEGETTVRFHSTDVAGNVENEGTVVVRIDKTMPVTTAQVVTNAGQATMTLTASDAGGSGLSRTYYALDGGAYIEYGGPVDVTTAHSAMFYSVDGAGNEETPGSVAIVNDVTAPVSACDAPSGWQLGPLPVTVNVTATDEEGGSGLAAIWYSLNGGAYQSSSTSPAVLNLQNGKTTIRYYAVDKSGNVEATKTATVLVDAAAPTVSAKITPTAWTTGNATATFTASDTVSGLNLASAECYVDGARVAFTYGQAVTISAEGVHTVRFSIADKAGNVATTADVTAQIDRTRPETGVTAVTTGGAAYTDGAWTNKNVTLTFAASDAGSGVAITQSSTNGGATWTTGTSRSVSMSGTTTVLYRSKDKAGNVEDAHTIVVRIDKVAPTITIAAPLSGGTYVRNQEVLAAWTATDTASGVNPAAGSSTAPLGSPINTATFGSKSFKVSVADNAGNTASRTVNYSVPFASTGITGVDANGITVGASVPLSFALTNSTGRPYTTATATLWAAPAQESGWGVEIGGNAFTNAGLGIYTADWDTTGLAAGVWRLRVDLGRGGALYAQVTLTQ